MAVEVRLHPAGGVGADRPAVGKVAGAGNADLGPATLARWLRCADLQPTAGGLADALRGCEVDVCIFLGGACGRVCFDQLRPRLFARLVGVELVGGRRARLGFLRHRGGVGGRGDVVVVGELHPDPVGHRLTPEGVERLPERPLGRPLGVSGRVAGDAGEERLHVPQVGLRQGFARRDPLREGGVGHRRRPLLGGVTAHPAAEGGIALCCPRGGLAFDGFGGRGRGCNLHRGAGRGGGVVGHRRGLGVVKVALAAATVPDDLGLLGDLHELAVGVLRRLNQRPERGLQVQDLGGVAGGEAGHPQGRVNPQAGEVQVAIDPDQVLPCALHLPGEDAEPLQPHLRLDVAEVVGARRLGAKAGDRVADGAPLVLGAHVDDALQPRVHLHLQEFDVDPVAQFEHGVAHVRILRQGGEGGVGGGRRVRGGAVASEHRHARAEPLPV